MLVDASLLLNNDWHSIATDVWQTPKEIFDKLVSNNLTFDCFASLHKKYGDDIHLLFDCSTRDGDLAKVQNYFDDGIMDVDEKQADEFQQILKEAIPEFKEAGVSLFIWDGVPWYDDLRNMTAHTILSLIHIYREEQISSQFDVSETMGDYRVFGKIAFNVLSDIKGKDYVLDSDFDKFRNWLMGDEDRCV